MFTPGQKVVYVGTGRDFLDRPMVVRRGGIYTVSTAFVFEGYQWAGPIPCITLVEVAPVRGCGWDARNFRPLTTRKTDITIFKKMLKPADELV